EAFRRRETYIARLKAGLPIDGDERNPRNPTFFEVAELYLKSHRGKPSTVESYQQILNQFWIPHLGQIPMLHMNYAQVLAADNATEWTSAKTRYNAKIPLSGVFKLGISTLEDFNTNFSEKLPKEKLGAPEIDPFSADEKAAILAALAKLDQDALDFFTLAFETGVRLPGELNALEWEQCNPAHIYIDRAFSRRRLTTPKTHEKRRVLLTPMAKTVLQRRPRPIHGGYVFTNTDGGPHLDGDIMNAWWRKAIDLANEKRQAPIRYRRAYNCRHTRATLDLMAGGKPAFLAKQQGHTMAQFFKSYGTWINSADDEAELAAIVAGRSGMLTERQNEESSI
ncbi:MAG: hypothetical protein AAGA91_04540, partial [Pseudomonadota bacterium]